MDKALVFAGIAAVVISKVVVLKSILIDLPAYERCVSADLGGGISVTHVCGTDPFIYFIVGWLVTAGGFILVISGLRMPAATARRSISR